MSTNGNEPLYSVKDLSKEELQVRVTCGDPIAEAWAWMLAYAEQINDSVSDYNIEQYGEFTVSADYLISVGMSHADGQWGEFISHGGSFESKSTDPLFWDKLGILMGREIGDQGSFFSCSC